MMKSFALCLALYSLFGSPAYAEEQSASPLAESVGPLEDRARETAALFVKDPEWSDEIFGKAFREQVSHARLESIFRSYYTTYGAVEQVVPMESTTKFSGVFLLLFEKGFEANLSLGIEGTQPYAIHTWVIGAPQPSVQSFDALGELLAKLEGEVSIGVYRLGAEELAPVYTLHADTALAMGSAFKLYVLGALIEEVAEGKRAWDDVLQLQSEFQSLPSGVLQTWPVGSSHTLETLAGFMISQSDNTAADHLLFALGRERVETQLVRMGNRHPERTIPFLSTAEVFELKWIDGGAPARTYLKLDTDERRAYLRKEVAALSIKDIDLSASASPLDIDTLEWFASAADLARALDWIRVHTEKGPASRARGLLAINPGISIPRDTFSYAGFKGGSEPGVLSLNWILQTPSDSWFVLSFTWNNPDAPVGETRLLGLASRAMHLLAKQIKAK